MTEAALGTARLDIEVDVSQLQAAIATAKNRLADMSTDAQKQYQQLNATEKRRVDALIRQADTLSLTRGQQLAYNAALRTSGPVLDEITRKIAANEAKLKSSTSQFNAYGLSAKQTALAMRQVPAQLTDIFVGLSTGQAPMMVLLQQGGQLKDLFGGIAPAARALGGALIGLVNPFTVTAGAAGLLSYAMYQSQQRAFELEKAIILSGNAAGVTASQIAQAAARIDEFSGTQRNAEMVLSQIVATGKVSAGVLETAAKAAVQLQRVAGVSVEDTIRNLVALGEKPTEASRKLLQQYGYLNAATVDRIRLLEDEGREAEAAALAQGRFSEEAIQRAEKLEAHLGTLPRLARGVGKVFSEMWEEILGLGAERTFADELADIERRLAGGSRAAFAIDGGGFLELAPGKAEVAQLEARRRQVLALMNQENLAAQQQAERAAQERATTSAREEWERIRLSNLSKQEKLEREIAEIRRIGLASRKSEAEIEAQVAAARSRAVERQSPKANADDNSARSLLETAQRQIEANNLLAATGEQVSASDRLAITVRQQLADQTNTMTVATRALLQALLPELEASEAAAVAAQNEAKAKAALERQNDALARQRAALQQKETNQQRSIAADLMGIGRGSDAREVMSRRLEIDIDYHEALDSLRDSGVAADSEAWAKQEAAARETRDRMLRREEEYQQQRALMMGDPLNGIRAAWEDYLDSARDVSGQTNELFSNAFGESEDALVEFVRTGKLSFSSLADSIIADLARIAAQRSILALFNVFSGGSGVSADSALEMSLSGRFATGGVVKASGLSAYSGQVVSKPTIFPFARGAGLMGEAGPEAIMPLKRTQGGRLGVDASGMGGNVVVNVHNAPAGTSVQRTRAPGGEIQIDVLLSAVEGSVARNIADGGSIAGAMKSRFNLREGM